MTKLLILNIAKLFGIINIVYVLDSTGLLVRDTSTMYYSFLEILRTAVLFICTCKQLNNEYKFVQLLIALKFWIVVIAARLSEIWIIK